MSRIFKNTKRKNEILARYLSDSAGMTKLAKYLQSPIKQQLLYEGVIRKAFYVEELPAGASPYYDKDPLVPAYVVAEEADTIMAVVKSKRVEVPMFEIAANPMVPYITIVEKRFDIVERAIEKGKSSIMEQEDLRAFTMMNAVAIENEAAGYNNLGGAVASLTPEVLADAFSMIESWRLRVSKIFVNPRDHADFRKFDRDILDPESQAGLLKTGIQGQLWGAHIVQSNIVPVNNVYITAEPEYFGRMPIRTDLQILTADDNRARQVGFSMFENIGLAVTNPLGLIRININRNL